MNIIELRTTSNKVIMKELYINNINNIFVNNYKTLYEFLNLFFNTESNLFLGNNKIDNKTCYIINLLDYESISSQLTLKKGTILYDYIINEIDETVEITDINEEINNKLLFLINGVLNDKTIQYDFEFNVDISKIINSYISINIDLSIENYIVNIRKLIHTLKEKNPRKNIIILLNTKIFANSLDDLDNVYIFKLYSNHMPNILIKDEIINLDKTLLINQLLLNWPYDTKEEDINNLIENFFLKYSISNILTIDNLNEFVGFKLISKILNLKVDFNVNNNLNESIPDLYKNYINSL